jgi:hypothetical protein
LLYVTCGGQDREAISAQVRCHDSCLRSSGPLRNRQHYMFYALKVGYLHESNLHTHLCRLELLPMHSQERQAPQLPYITLRRSNRAQRHSLVGPAIVRPAPHFLAQLGAISVNGVPEVVVSGKNLVIEGGV